MRALALSAALACAACATTAPAPVVAPLGGACDCAAIVLRLQELTADVQWVTQRIDNLEGRCSDE